MGLRLCKGKVLFDQQVQGGYFVFVQVVFSRCHVTFPNLRACPGCQTHVRFFGVGASGNDFGRRLFTYGPEQFVLYDFEKLKSTILQNKAQNIPTILFGVTYALLEFSAFFGIELVDHLTIIETGGMKGRGKELTRMELHETLSKHFEKATITSEYGMTEMFSQAYLDKTGWFVPGKTLKIIITEINDPLSIEKIGKTGRVNIIDLGNVDTCAFIATDDLGMIDEQGKFQIMGRLDHSDLRGCNLMVQDLS